MSNLPHITADGSATLYSERFGAHYHSLHGALTESEHVFIKAGLQQVSCNPVRVLEVGFGTGLNAALTAAYAQGAGITVDYFGLELYPLSASEMEQLNYMKVLPAGTALLWSAISRAAWSSEQKIATCFSLTKLAADFTRWVPQSLFNLVYFDAFAPNDQPEMWQLEQFEKLFRALEPGGMLVTYCVKGEVKRMLRDTGFETERLPGPPGKKHMLRAFRR